MNHIAGLKLSVAALTLCLAFPTHAQETQEQVIGEAPVAASEVQDHALPGGKTDEQLSGFAADFNKNDVPFDTTPYLKQIKAVEEYLSAFKTLNSRFSQTTSDDAMIVQGELQLARPGKMRLVYNRPDKIEIVVNAGKMRYYDVALDEVTFGNTPDSPFQILLYNDVKFEGGSQVTNVQEDDHSLAITIRPSNEAKRKTSFMAMTLVFQQNPLVLKRIVRTSDINHSTTIYLLDTILDAPLDDELFTMKNPEKKKKKN